MAAVVVVHMDILDTEVVAVHIHVAGTDNLRTAHHIVEGTDIASGVVDIVADRGNHLSTLAVEEVEFRISLLVPFPTQHVAFCHPHPYH